MHIRGLLKLTKVAGLAITLAEIREMKWWIEKSGKKEANNRTSPLRGCFKLRRWHLQPHLRRHYIFHVEDSSQHCPQPPQNLKVWKLCTAIDRSQDMSRRSMLKDFLLSYFPQILQITTPLLYWLGIKTVTEITVIKTEMRGRRSRQCQPRRQGPLAQGNKPHVQPQLMQMYPWPCKDWSCLSWNRYMKAFSTPVDMFHGSNCVSLSACRRTSQLHYDPKMACSKLKVLRLRRMSPLWTWIQSLLERPMIAATLLPTTAWTHNLKVNIIEPVTVTHSHRISTKMFSICHASCFMLLSSIES